VIVISAPSELIRAVGDILREAPGMILGGFLGYVAHEIYHAIWKRPGHLLLRKLFRKRQH
jgi:hypothetical protein